MDSIKITALTPIGGNIAYTTLIPVVNMAGTPLTQKATAQVLGNLILNSAGGSYFPPAAQAILAQSVTNAAQPNITSTGTLTALNVTGNINAGNVNGGNIVVANFYYGDGGFLSNISGNGGNANTGNITFTGSNISTNAANADINVNASLDGNISLLANNHIFLTVDDSVDPHGGVEMKWNRTDAGVTKTAGISINSDYGNTELAVGSVQVVVCSNLANGLANSTWTFTDDGALYWPGIGEKAVELGSDNALVIHSDTNVRIVTDIYDSSRQFVFNNVGDFYAPGNVTMAGTRINIGPGSEDIVLTGPSIVAKGNAQLVQMAIFNDQASGSSDYLMYGLGGDETQGWAGVGFNGPAFDLPQFSITRPGDAGFFIEGYANGIGGNMILATGDQGLGQDIIIGLGGFTADDEFARFSLSNNALELNKLNSALSTPPSDAYSLPAPDVLVSTNTAQWSEPVPTLTNSKGCWSGTGTYADDVILYTTVNILTPTVASFWTDQVHTIPYALPAGLLDAPGSFDYGTKAFDLNIKGGPAISPDKGLGGDIILTASDGTPTEWRFTTTGNLIAPGNVILSGEKVLVGPGADLISGLEGATLIISANNQAILQAVIENVSDIGSADWVAQGHYGTDAGGWVDMGINSTAYDDPVYAMTGPGDGYVLVEGFLPGQTPNPTGGGNLVLSTGENGSVRDIIFGTGGFATANIFGKISDANNALELTRTGSKITLSGGNVTGANVMAATTFQSTVVAFSALPAATTAGLRAFINDANLVAAGNFGAIVGSSGSNIVPVYSDGTNWLIG